MIEFTLPNGKRVIRTPDRLKTDRIQSFLSEADYIVDQNFQIYADLVAKVHQDARVKGIAMAEVQTDGNKAIHLWYAVDQGVYMPGLTFDEFDEGRSKLKNALAGRPRVKEEFLEPMQMCGNLHDSVDLILTNNPGMRLILPVIDFIEPR